MVVFPFSLLPRIRSEKFNGFSIQRDFLFEKKIAKMSFFSCCYGSSSPVIPSAATMEIEEIGLKVFLDLCATQF